MCCLLVGIQGQLVMFHRVLKAEDLPSFNFSKMEVLHTIFTPA